MRIDREYYSSLLRIALPITTQNFLTSFLNVIDVTMLGQLGEISVASVGLANQIFFLLILMLFGTYSGVGVFTAQLWGKKDLVNVRKVLGIGLIIGLTGSFLFTILALVFPEAALSFYSKDPQVIATGSSYLRIVGWVYMVTAVTFAYSSVLRSTGFVRVPMMVSVSALSLKTILNYCLIFGNMGFPALGVQGAAIATVIARLLELAAILAITYWKKLPPAAKISEMLGFNRAFLGNVLKTSLPVLINEMLWSFGITTYNMVYGRIGTEAIAAMNIAASIENLAFVVFIGLSEATGIMIGNRIGAGDEGKAFTYARRTLVISTAGAILIGLIILFNIDFILSFYKLSEIARANAHNILTVMGCVFWIRISNLVIIVGVLRAGGDTRFSMFLDAGTVWFVGVPLALICGLVLHWPVYLVYLLIVSEELIKYFIALWRFISRRWVNNLVQTV
ncbi:MAG: MATE family efflux transporter [Anaerolineaceae bacterium]|nr:MATE family efflux transporter [Anaerolineaceae bacterium]